MIGFSKRILAGAAALACVAVSPAQAACWSNEAVDAAMVRDLETMLMVSSLRCRAGDGAMLSAYNRFVSGARPALTQINEVLRGHFGSGTAALNAYDGYVTKVANRYGAGADGLNCDDMTSILQAANAEAGSRAGLIRMAHNAGVVPLLPGGQCGVTDSVQVAAR